MGFTLMRRIWPRQRRSAHLGSAVLQSQSEGAVRVYDNTSRPGESRAWRCRCRKTSAVRTRRSRNQSKHFCNQETRAIRPARVYSASVSSANDFSLLPRLQGLLTPNVVALGLSLEHLKFETRESLEHVAERTVGWIAPAIRQVISRAEGHVLVHSRRAVNLGSSLAAPSIRVELRQPEELDDVAFAERFVNALAKYKDWKVSLPGVHAGPALCARLIAAAALSVHLSATAAGPSMLVSLRPEDGEDPVSVSVLWGETIQMLDAATLLRLPSIKKAAGDAFNDGLTELHDAIGTLDTHHPSSPGNQLIRHYQSLCKNLAPFMIRTAFDQEIDSGSKILVKQLDADFAAGRLVKMGLAPSIRSASQLGVKYMGTYWPPGPANDNSRVAELRGHVIYNRYFMKRLLDNDFLTPALCAAFGTAGRHALVALRKQGTISAAAFNFLLGVTQERPSDFPRRTGV